jgi:hypothetical protein
MHQQAITSATMSGTPTRSFQGIKLNSIASTTVSTM